MFNNNINEVNIWSVPPISDDKILPDTPAPDEPTTNMFARGCRGQYIPLSFCIRSSQSLVGLKAEVVNENKSLGLNANIRYVKCWWQAGDDNSYKSKPTFTPELLLKDPGLVVVDMEKL